MLISPAFAQEAAATAAGVPQQPPSMLASMLPLIIMFVALYFLMIRPQLKKQKEQRAMLDALAKGDEVVTQGGLVGRIATLGENMLGLQVASGVQVQVQRHAIVQVLPRAIVQVLPRGSIKLDKEGKDKN